MPTNRKRYPVFLLTLFLGACSVVRLTYDQAHTITYWWLDSYLDFTDAQEAQVKNDLREIHQWHRTTQLPEYADILVAIGSRTLDDSSPAATCEVIDKANIKIDIFAARITPYLARLAQQLSPAQLAHVRKTFAEKDETWREKWMDPKPEELATARYEDWLGRAENFYGDINDEQKTFMKNAIARSALDLKISWIQRQQRQQDILASLGKIVESNSSQNVAEEQVSAMLDRSLRPKDPAYKAMFQSVLTETCANLAGLHQLTTQKQRRHAQEKLAGYARDFRLLSNN